MTGQATRADPFSASRPGRPAKPRASEVVRHQRPLIPGPRQAKADLPFQSGPFASASHGRARARIPALYGLASDWPEKTGRTWRFPQNSRGIYYNFGGNTT